MRRLRGHTTAVVQPTECGDQLDGETVVDGGPVGGVLGLPADRGGGEGRRVRSQPDEDQHSPTVHWTWCSV